VGRDPERIVAVASEVLRNPPAKPDSPLWDGRAGQRIAKRLLDRLSRPDAPRPTDLDAAACRRMPSTELAI
jgi:UDP-N-acetylglucosamine 2-epimerase (non-hydrolysing)